MRIVLFCENKYSIDILSPIEAEAVREGNNQVLWYVHKKKIPNFPLAGSVNWTNSIQDVYDFSPQAIFVPGNIVPYYLPGVKIQVFHGYAGEKKGHWVIRGYFDTYFTQGPHFTEGFKKLAEIHKNFEVVETGWPRQDWVKEHLHAYDKDKERLLQEHGKKHLVLYAPTFSPSLTSIPFLEEAIKELVAKRSVLLMIKLHPLTKPEWVDIYKKLAEECKDILFMEDTSVAKYQLMADIMISDTSSVIYEFLLKDKPVITFNASSKRIYWKNITDPSELCDAFDSAVADEDKERRKWFMENYDPYLDGKVGHRMLEAARDYIKRNGVPRCRKVNLWRKYTGIKTFGWIKRG